MTNDPSFQKSYLGIRGWRKLKHPFRFHRQIPFANTETYAVSLSDCSLQGNLAGGIQEAGLCQLSLNCFYLTDLHARYTGL